MKYSNLEIILDSPDHDLPVRQILHRVGYTWHSGNSLLELVYPDTYSYVTDSPCSVGRSTRADLELYPNVHSTQFIALEISEVL